MTSFNKFAVGTAMCLAISATASAQITPQAPELLPQISNPGECYARVKVPAEYATSRQGVVAEEAYSALEIREPQLQARQESIMTKEASTRFKVRQPSYRTVSEQIMVRPAYEKLSVTQPQFSTVKEAIQTSAPHLVWKKGNPAQLRAQGYTIHSTADGRPQSGYGASNMGYSSDQSAFQAAGLGGQECGVGCEIWCLVEEPGETKTISRRVMTTPGNLNRTPVPAKYKTVSKQVVSDPGGVEYVEVPAEYSSVTIEDLVDPGGVVERPIAPTYASVETKQLISPERYEWRRVLCAPGTGSIKSSSEYRSESSYASGTLYSSHTSAGGTYSSGTSYSAPNYNSPSAPAYSAPSYQQPSYSGFQSMPSGTSQGGYYDRRTGYYGEENYPAYQKRRDGLMQSEPRKVHRPRR